MAMATHKASGIPLAEGLDSVLDLPHTMTYAIMYREQLDSFNELPKDKRPPRKLWDRPYELGKYMESVWSTDKKDADKEFYNYELEDLE